MRLVCTATTAPDGTRHDRLLSVGKAYLAYTLSFIPHRGAFVRVLTDLGNDALGMYPIQMFSILEGSMPRRWSIGIRPDGTVELAPRAWLPEGFWEDDFDDPPTRDHGDLVRREMREIETESSLSD